jgi:hypothetical protein
VPSARADWYRQPVPYHDISRSFSRLATLPAVGLRLASEIGTAALEQVAKSGPTALAELDQHLTAVRTAIIDSEVRYRPTAAATARAVTDARIGPVPAAELDGASERRLDVPNASEAATADSSLAMELLQHYACGFLEEAVAGGWWPARQTAASRLDWQSVRLAALCRLINVAEAATQIPPDLAR